MLWASSTVSNVAIYRHTAVLLRKKHTAVLLTSLWLPYLIMVDVRRPQQKRYSNLKKIRPLDSLKLPLPQPCAAPDLHIYANRRWRHTRTQARQTITVSWNRLHAYSRIGQVEGKQQEAANWQHPPVNYLPCSTGCLRLRVMHVNKVCDLLLVTENTKY